MCNSVQQAQSFKDEKMFDRKLKKCREKMKYDLKYSNRPKVSMEMLKI